MRDFQNTFETRKQSLNSDFSICTAVPLKKLETNIRGFRV